MSAKKNLGTDLLLSYNSVYGIKEDTDLEKTNRFRSLSEDDRTRVAYLSDPIFGISYEELEDVATATGPDNIVQSLINRVMTLKGELEELGHPEYGSRHHELIEAPNTESNRNLVKFHILECLSHEPRIKRVIKTDVMTFRGRPNLVQISIDIEIIDESNPVNLVVPFSFEG